MHRISFVVALWSGAVGQPADGTAARLQQTPMVPSRRFVRQGQAPARPGAIFRAAETPTASEADRGAKSPIADCMLSLRHPVLVVFLVACSVYVAQVAQAQFQGSARILRGVALIKE